MNAQNTGKDWVQIPEGRKDLDVRVANFKKKVYGYNCVFNMATIIFPARGAEQIIAETLELERMGVEIQHERVYEITRGLVFASLMGKRKLPREYFSQENSVLNYDELIPYLNEEEKYWVNKLGVSSEMLEQTLDREIASGKITLERQANERAKRTKNC